MRADPTIVRVQERAAVEALYPSARNVIATPINPPVKGFCDDDRSGPARERGADQQHPHP